MKNFKFCIASLAIFALLFTSCSKDEVSSVQDTPNAKMATISFGAVLNDFVANRAALKAPLTGDVPVCSDAAPGKVRVALKNSGGMWVAGQNGDAGGFIEIPVIPDGEGGWMTKESSDLELPEGMYSLEYFAVLDAGNNILWIAPRENDVYGPANFAAFVNDALPIAINLRVGVKKYIDVEVLCYDQRFADEFGYLFFDFTEIDTLTFCVFGNDCNDIGRHFPSYFSLEVWTYSGNAGSPKGQPLTNGALKNEIGQYEDGEAFSKPLCIALPDREGEDLYYIEIYLLDRDNPNAPGELIRFGIFNDTQVRALYNGETNTYYHFRANCDGEDTPPIFDEPGMEVSIYCTDLDPLNNSGLDGAAILRLAGNKLTVSILAMGAEANKVHAQHIHGKIDGSNATCPPLSAGGADNLISLAEGLPYYGDVLLPLQIYPTASAIGEIDYQESFILGQGGLISAANLNSMLNPLINRVIVLHGKTVNGSYDGSLPIACGEVKKLN